jgi:hypothetical protein
MLVFKALHILAMFGAVTFLVGEAVFAAVAIWRGDVRALAAMRRITGRRPVVAATLFVVGIGFGLLTVATGGFDFFAGWLIAAYVMVVVLFAMNGLPIVQKGLVGITDKAIETEAGRVPAEEVVREMAIVRRPILAVVAANIVIFALLVLDMVLKPF